VAVNIRPADNIGADEALPFERVAIVGATGPAGMYLARNFIADGLAVRAGGRSPGGRAPLRADRPAL